MREIPDGAVVISPDQVYAKLEETHHTMLEVKGAVETLAAARSDHEARIRSLERRMWVLFGVAAGLALFSDQLAALVDEGIVVVPQRGTYVAERQR